MEGNNPIPVTIITRKGQAVLVEYQRDGGPARASLPVSSVLAGPGDSLGWTSQEELDRGIDYGLPWAELVKGQTITAEAIERALRAAGIWTIEDYYKKPGMVMGAMISLLSPVMVNLQNSVQRIKNKEI